MFSKLFINASILISFLFLGSQIFKKRGINPKSEVRRRILLGVLCGFVGIVVMFYKLATLNGVILDLRMKSLIVSSIYGGFISAFLTALIIILFRLLYFGIDIAALQGIVVTIIFLIVFTYISRLKKSFFIRYSIMTVIDFSLGVVVYMLFIGECPDKSFLMVFSIFANIVVSIIVYYLLDYITYNRILYEKLKIQSKKDFLTGLNNVREFNNLFSKAKENAIKNDENISILLIDIDFFKFVNDKYGHHAGDEVLKAIGKILVDSCRFFDVVSRNGGEEFTVILLNCNKKESLEIGERIRKNVEEHIFVINYNEKIHITVSIGVSCYENTKDSIEDLYNYADQALYLAKQGGRNLVCLK